MSEAFRSSVSGQPVRSGREEEGGRNRLSLLCSGGAARTNAKPGGHPCAIAWLAGDPVAARARSSLLAARSEKEKRAPSEDGAHKKVGQTDEGGGNAVCRWTQAEGGGFGSNPVSGDRRTEGGGFGRRLSDRLNIVRDRRFSNAPADMSAMRLLQECQRW